MARYFVFAVIVTPLFLLDAQAKFSKVSKIELSPVFHRTFKQPVFVTVYPAAIPNCGEPYAVVEKPGRIRIESLTRACNQILLNHTAHVKNASLEEGLLGLAFDAQFSKTGVFYIYYSVNKPRRTVLSRMRVANPTTPKLVHEERLMTFKQPFSNHKGGMLEFGPDGFLYVGLGDGGSGGDPHGNAQNLRSHLGKILRIDVATKKEYRIPKDNPYAKSKGDAWHEKREIFAYGLRNPWRFSFAPDGRLLVADVGQNMYEELSFVGLGDNMGWNLMEGFHCFQPPKGCAREGLRLPFFEYDHGTGQSILGGYYYAGNEIPSLRGRYIFADSVSGRIFAINPAAATPRAEELVQVPGLYSSFGKLRDGELAIAELMSGKIFKLKPSKQVSEKIEGAR